MQRLEREKTEINAATSVTTKQRYTSISTLSVDAPSYQSAQEALPMALAPIPSPIQGQQSKSDAGSQHLLSHEVDVEHVDDMERVPAGHEVEAERVDNSVDDMDRVPAGHEIEAVNDCHSVTTPVVVGDPEVVLTTLAAVEDHGDHISLQETSYKSAVDEVVGRDLEADTSKTSREELSPDFEVFNPSYSPPTAHHSDVKVVGIQSVVLSLEIKRNTESSSQHFTYDAQQDFAVSAIHTKEVKGSDIVLPGQNVVSVAEKDSFTSLDLNIPGVELRHQAKVKAGGEEEVVPGGIMGFTNTTVMEGGPGGTSSTGSLGAVPWQLFDAVHVSNCNTQLLQSHYRSMPQFKIRGQGGFALSSFLLEPHRIVHEQRTALVLYNVETSLMEGLWQAINSTETEVEFTPVPGSFPGLTPEQYTPLLEQHISLPPSPPVKLENHAAEALIKLFYDAMLMSASPPAVRSPPIAPQNLMTTQPLNPPIAPQNLMTTQPLNPPIAPQNLMTTQPLNPPIAPQNLMTTQPLRLTIASVQQQQQQQSKEAATAILRPLIQARTTPFRPTMVTSAQPNLQNVPSGVLPPHLMVTRTMHQSFGTIANTTAASFPPSQGLAAALTPSSTSSAPTASVTPNTASVTSTAVATPAASGTAPTIVQSTSGTAPTIAAPLSTIPFRVSSPQPTLLPTVAPDSQLMKSVEPSFSRQMQQPRQQQYPAHPHNAAQYVPPPPPHPPAPANPPINSSALLNSTAHNQTLDAPTMIYSPILLSRPQNIATTGAATNSNTVPPNTRQTNSTVTSFLPPPPKRPEHPHIMQPAVKVSPTFRHSISSQPTPASQPCPTSSSEPPRHAHTVTAPFSVNISRPALLHASQRMHDGSAPRRGSSVPPSSPAFVSAPSPSQHSHFTTELRPTTPLSHPPPPPAPMIPLTPAVEASPILLPAVEASPILLPAAVSAPVSTSQSSLNKMLCHLCHANKAGCVNRSCRHMGPCSICLPASEIVNSKSNKYKVCFMCGTEVDSLMVIKIS
ncbi:hypothetical protein CEUSTIGMA_g2890.t1 [Chlamydomonas eustigma]|uniref:Uncharacterized protein n=1 Tax=Chlamydomonas eustigma TaxID=1157962 RepID=A0A250WXD3_9CHLO|nr:hypothetical protein CEUSTIGMA_g2890.t1 [Chlamydomonas eustigma]|eukprot:GAX75446.1 hypothetical protein CEUSTIGMA_g2890.t1 [Chlamydomonas eustigma]